MPVVEDEVPQWKKELIQKKQLWRRSGGWSVPPVSLSKTGLKLRPAGVERIPDGAVVERRRSGDGAGTGFAGSVENLSVFGSVSELKTKFQPEDEAYEPLTRARSEENILDGAADSGRRSSTSQFSGYRQNGAAATRTVPKMEDFLRKYRKTTRKTVAEQNQADSPKPAASNTRRKRSDTVYFLDMNQNELPPPNTVKQTVKSFEEPVKTGANSPKTDSDEMTSPTDVRARDVVRRFEEKIRSSAAPPKPPRAIRGDAANKPSKPPKPSTFGGSQDPQKNPKHVSFDTDVLRVQNDGATDVLRVQNDLRTVTINTNQPLVIKTV